jgi:protein phosphatase PTC1
MVIRFDNKALKQRKTEAQMGVDMSAKAGGVSEADAIVSQAKKDNGIEPEPVEKVAEEMIMEEEEAEPGPELNIDAVKAAQKHPPSS